MSAYNSGIVTKGGSGSTLHETDLVPSCTLWGLNWQPLIQQRISWPLSHDASCWSQLSTLKLQFYFTNYSLSLWTYHRVPFRIKYGRVGVQNKLGDSPIIDRFCEAQKINTVRYYSIRNQLLRICYTPPQETAENRIGTVERRLWVLEYRSCCHAKIPFGRIIFTSFNWELNINFCKIYLRQHKYRKWEFHITLL